MRLNLVLSLSFVLVLLVSSSQLLAQTSIKGTLLQKGTRIPLSDTNVFILPFKLKATTDASGKFIFPEVPLKDFRFIVNKSGHLRLDQEIKINDKDSRLKNITLYLEKESYDVFETVVTGKEIKKDVTRRVLTQKDFLKAPGAQEDPVRAIQNLPGIANQAFSSQIVIQGSEPDDTLYSINGHEIPLIFHFGGLTSVITPTAVENVEFLAAGFGPEYGRALGGVINLNTKKGDKKRWHGEGFIDITKLGTLFEGPVGENSSLVASARVSYFGRVLEQVAEDMDDFAVTSAPEFQDYYINYHTKLSADEDFEILALSSKDTLNLILKEGADPNIEGNLSNVTTFYRVLPRYRKKLNEKVKLDVSLAYGEDNLNFNIGERFFDLKSTVITQRGEVEFKVSDKSTWYFGTDIQWRRADLTLLLPQRSNIGGVSSGAGRDVFAQIEQTTTDAAFYTRNTLKLSEKFSLSPGFRAEYFSITEKGCLMPRINSSYKYNKSTIFNFATGLYYQAPQNGENSEEFGNPSTKSEKTTHYLISLEKDLREGSNQGLQFDIGLFYKELNDLIVNTSSVRSDGTSVRNLNQGDGTVKGLQLGLNYKRNEYTLAASYTYLDSKREDPENGDYSSEFDQTHNLNLIGMYERAKWSFSTRLRFVTGNPYTPVIGANFDSDNDLYIPIRGSLFSERFEDFFQLDLRVDRKFIYNTWILSAYLDIQNVTNQKNGQGISYSYNYAQSEQTAGLPIIPIIGVRGEF